MSVSATDAPTETVDAHRKFWTLALGSVGVVYGDIGTSPLYAVRESLAHVSSDGFTTAEILGVISLLFWALMLVVTVKYVVFLMRADNRGEGGTLSLMALALRARLPIGSGALIGLGVLGAAFFYADAAITPAISVLSAIEGLNVITPAFEPFVLPLALVIIVALFAAQSRGTAHVARWFGPICVVWFAAIALMGVVEIARDPRILAALDPRHAIDFFVEHGPLGFVVLGSVFLAVTGAEALYADMGHFGRKPIRVAWLAFVLPALALNYFGQGALLMNRPAAIANPFFLMAPGWALAPLVILATAATVIASQAVITGAYSLTQQAIQLGLLPRMGILHTSEELRGQIYIPRVNWILLAAVLALVLGFRSSSALASAYGIAVSGTMVVTTLLALAVARGVWRWSWAPSLAVIVPLLAIDLIFFASNVLKVFDGGYVPLLAGLALVTLMWTWWRGTRYLHGRTVQDNVALADVVDMLTKRPPHRIPGTAVFLTSDPEVAPAALMHNLKHNRVLHARNLIVTIRTADLPRVPPEERMTVDTLTPDFARVTLNYGYMQRPNVARALADAPAIQAEKMSTSYFLTRRSLLAAPDSGLPRWQDKLFIILAKTAADASEFYGIPGSRTVELGSRVLV